MGLGEGAYARQRSATAVFGDGERESLNEQVGERVFRTATDEAREAMLLLTERVRVTPGDVMLSYAGQDDNGNPQLPAYALTAIEDELELEPPTTTESHSVPAWRRARSSNLIVHGQELERQRAVYFSQAADRRRGQGNAFDGQLSPTTVAELASELSDGRLTHWSASRLESWRQCPHQFFMRHVLRFYEPDEQPLEAEPTALDQLHELATQEHSPAAFWRKYERVLDVVGLSDTNLIPTPDRDRWEETID
ncbi:MAG: PD-(D/E)XK nuclease family protein, partial [Gemmatimonadota bacterium]